MFIVKYVIANFIALLSSLLAYYFFDFLLSLGNHSLALAICFFLIFTIITWVVSLPKYGWISSFFRIIIQICCAFLIFVGSYGIAYPLIYLFGRINNLAISYLDMTRFLLWFSIICILAIAFLITALPAYLLRFSIRKFSSIVLMAFSIVILASAEFTGRFSPAPMFARHLLLVNILSQIIIYFVIAWSIYWMYFERN